MHGTPQPPDRPSSIARDAPSPHAASSPPPQLVRAGLPESFTHTANAAPVEPSINEPLLKPTSKAGGEGRQQCRDGGERLLSTWGNGRGVGWGRGPWRNGPGEEGLKVERRREEGGEGMECGVQRGGVAERPAGAGKTAGFVEEMRGRGGQGAKGKAEGEGAEDEVYGRKIGLDLHGGGRGGAEASAHDLAHPRQPWLDHRSHQLAHQGGFQPSFRLTQQLDTRHSGRRLCGAAGLVSGK
ncbi:hypothetical protein JCM11251_006907 [Rhodosporidiobolus azoricus]